MAIKPGLLFQNIDGSSVKILTESVGHAVG